MSLHSYSRVWLHLVWGTLERRPLLPKAAAGQVSGYLSEYASGKGFYMKINYVNPDHVHVLVDLPTALAVEDMMQLELEERHKTQSAAEAHPNVCPSP